MIAADTHSAIWLMTAQHLLSTDAALALAEASAHDGIAISGVTLYETAVAVSKKRVLIEVPLDIFLSHMETQFIVLPVTALIAEQAINFSRAYPKDPADRMIGATAVVHRLKLVTADGQIRASKEVDCIW